MVACGFGWKSLTHFSYGSLYVVVELEALEVTEMFYFKANGFIFITELSLQWVVRGEPSERILPPLQFLIPSLTFCSFSLTPYKASPHSRSKLQLVN